MSTERRLVLFVLLSFAMVYGTRMLLVELGLAPKPAANVAAQKQQQQQQQWNQPEAGGAEVPAPGGVVDQGGAAKAGAGGAGAAAAAAERVEAELPPAPENVEVLKAEDLVLGSTDPKSPFLLEAQFDQRGAGIALLSSSRLEAEIKEGQPRNRPLILARSRFEDRPWQAPSFAMTLEHADPGQPNVKEEAENPAEEEGLEAEASLSARELLDRAIWEVVRGADGQAVQKVSRASKTTGQAEEGQELKFRARPSLSSGAMEILKTFRLWPGENTLEMEITLKDAGAGDTVVYRLQGAHGLPIEGEWFTGTFRDVFFGGYTPAGDEILTKSAQDIVKHADNPERFTSLPLKYTGVENQYFAVFLGPVPVPTSREQSWIDEARPTIIEIRRPETQKSDVSVELISKPVTVKADREVTHAYRIFAGAKTAESLSAVDAFELSVYRKGFSLPLIGDLGARFMSKNFIAPMLSRTYAATAWVGRLFGFQRGNYGIAIILLTMLVRLLLFPLGRKQARAAQKMQDLQPLIVELKEKYKDDKERLTRETFALYKKYGVNPMGGCLPALVQFPVLIGLWQALNNSVALRHSRFLWIDNLAAPDMLFKFPFQIPLVGGWLGPYFNVLPIVVVVLMLFQTKLFSPPPTTPEAEQQQKTMKFMMIFMAFLFYKVPAGLSIYFITSSLWQIGERLLLPKSSLAAALAGGGVMTSTTSAAPAQSAQKSKAAASSPATRPGRTEGQPPASSKGGWWSAVRQRAQARFEQIMDDAASDRTARKDTGKGGGRESDRKSRPRPS